MIRTLKANYNNAASRLGNIPSYNGHRITDISPHHALRKLEVNYVWNKMLFNRHSRSNAGDRDDDVLADQLICAEKVGCRAFTAKSHRGVSAETVRRLSAPALLHSPV